MAKSKKAVPAFHRPKDAEGRTFSGAAMEALERMRGDRTVQLAVAVLAARVVWETRVIVADEQSPDQVSIDLSIHHDDVADAENAVHELIRQEVVRLIEAEEKG